MDRPVDDDCSPGVGINSEEEYELNNDYYTVGPFKVSKRNCWILGVVIVVLAAGAVLATVVIKTKGNSEGSGSGGGAPSSVKQSAAYYQERFAVFRPTAGRLSATSALVQSSTLHEIVEYAPSLSEWKITAGIWGLGLLVFTAALKVALPVLRGDLQQIHGPQGDAHESPIAGRMPDKQVK